jgi:hypothetical protein
MARRTSATKNTFGQRRFEKDQFCQLDPGLEADQRPRPSRPLGTSASTSASATASFNPPIQPSGLNHTHQGSDEPMMPTIMRPAAATHFDAAQPTALFHAGFSIKVIDLHQRPSDRVEFSCGNQKRGWT